MTYTVLEFLIYLRDEHFCCPLKDDKGRIGVSNKQLQRWIDSGAVIINNHKMKSKDILTNKIDSLVFFPKNNNKKITIM